MKRFGARLQHDEETKIPTIMEALLANLEPPSEEQSKRLAELKNLAFDCFTAFGQFVIATAQRVKRESPASAYADYLISRGVAPGTSQALAALVLSISKGEVREQQQMSQAFRALRYFANGACRQSASIKHARKLLAFVDESSELGALFKSPAVKLTDPDAALQSEFMLILEEIAPAKSCGKKSRLKTIARGLAPVIRSRRGRKASLPSVTHERFLELLASIDRPHAYTLSQHGPRSNGDFTDGATLATRAQFGLANFDPRPAHRRRRKNAGSARSSRASRRPTATWDPSSVSQ